MKKKKKDLNIFNIQLFQISAWKPYLVYWDVNIIKHAAQGNKGEKKNKKLSSSQSTFISHFNVHSYFIQDRLLAQVIFKTGFSCHSA